MFSCIEAPLPELPAEKAHDYSGLVGKKVKNGPRGRKIFTVVSIDPNGGGRAVILHDKDGVEYHGNIGAAARLVLV